MRAFTLIELLVTIFLATIIIFVFSILLGFSLNTYEYIDENMSSENASFLINYLTNEINASENIYPQESKFIHKDYSNGLGFILQQCNDPSSDKKEYTYIYFALKDDKLYRIAQSTQQANINSNEVNFQTLGNSGVNAVAEGIKDISCNFNEEKSLIKIDITLNDNKNYSTSIYCYGG